MMALVKQNVTLTNHLLREYYYYYYYSGIFPMRGRWDAAGAEEGAFSEGLELSDAVLESYCPRYYLGG